MRIGFATQNPSSQYWLLVNYGVRERARELGIEVILTPSYTLDQQIAAIRAFVDQRVDLLLLGPIVAFGLASTIEDVRAAGIPVIVLATHLSDCAVDCTVRSDHRKGAEMAATHMVELLDGSGEVAHLVGPSRLQDNIDRAMGVRHVLAQHPRIQLAFEQESPDWESASGAAMMHEALAQYPRLRGVCAATDTLALGALRAIERAGQTGNIVVTGFDAMPDALIAIHEERMSATVRQSIRGIGHTAVEMAQRIANGETVPSLVHTDIALVTRANLLETTLDSVYLLPSVLSDVVEHSEALFQAREVEAMREQQLGKLALQESDERFRRLAEAAFEGIVIHDQGSVVDANMAAMALFGYEEQELIGKYVTELIPPEVAGMVLEHIRRQSEHSYESLVVRKDGTKLPVEVRGKTLLSSGRTLRITVIRDITEQKRAEANLKQAKRDADAANRAKSEFLATVSHELRTPLTSIRGALGLVTGGVTGPVSPEAKTMLDIAYKNSERLVRMINDILDIEKIEAGKMTFDAQVLDLIPLVEQTLAANRGYAEEFGVSYALTAPEPGLQVNGNADHLTQVLTNLLSNAAKFSSVGGTVEVSVVRQGAMVRIAVADNGMGIPAEFHSRIFQKFAQADSSDTRQKGGTGLGLSIARAIVEKHGGQIGFSSNVGPGTIFYFDLPVV